MPVIQQVLNNNFSPITKNLTVHNPIPTFPNHILLTQPIRRSLQLSQSVPPPPPQMRHLGPTFPLANDAVWLFSVLRLSPLEAPLRWWWIISWIFFGDYWVGLLRGGGESLLLWRWRAVRQTKRMKRVRTIKEPTRIPMTTQRWRPN